MADIISFNCHESFTIEELEKWYEEGTTPQREGVINYVYSSGHNTLEINGKDLEISDFKIDDQNALFILSTVLEQGNPFSPGKSYEFSNYGEYDFDGTLKIYSTGGFAGKRLEKTMLCLLNQD